MGLKKDVCPICAGGNLREHSKKNRVSYNGHEADIDALFSSCDSCGSEQASAAQARANKRAMTKFKKCVDGLLNGAEVRIAREKLGINQSEAARIFGGGPVAFSKYESDDVTQSEAMDKLLRIATSVPGAFEFLAERAGYSLERGLVTEKVVDDSWESLLPESQSTSGARLEVLQEYTPEPRSNEPWTAAQA